MRETLGIIDYIHVICLFLTQNDSKLAHHQKILIPRNFLIWV